jgi:hypothetical protein
LKRLATILLCLLFMASQISCTGMLKANKNKADKSSSKDRDKKVIETTSFAADGSLEHTFEKEEFKAIKISAAAGTCTDCELQISLVGESAKLTEALWDERLGFLISVTNITEPISISLEIPADLLDEKSLDKKDDWKLTKDDKDIEFSVNENALIMAVEVLANIFRISHKIPADVAEDAAAAPTDTTSPVLTTLTPPSNGVYGNSRSLDFTATFSEEVIVTGSPSLSIDISGSTYYAAYQSGSGTNSLIFQYTATALNDLDGIGFNATVFAANEVEDAAGNDATLDFAVPDLSGVVVSAPWVTQIGDTTGVAGGDSSGTDLCNGIGRDSAGNIYCAGYTTGGLGEGGSGGNFDAFVMKMNPAGELQWITQLGDTTFRPGGTAAANTGDDQCQDIAADSSGNSYCAGSTSGDLGEGNGANNGDAFVMKLDPSGAIVWITQLGDSTTAGGDNANVDSCNSVALDSFGNVYCSGYTKGAVGEGNGTGDDAFVMKLNSTTGAVVWVTQLGDTTTAAGGNNSGDDVCYGVAVDAAGNVYCSGGTTGALGETNGGSTDAFLMKLDSDGDIVWLTQFGDTTFVPGGSAASNAGNESCSAVSVDLSGNVYCVGSTTGALGETSGGSHDIFALKLNSSGAVQWVSQLGTPTMGATKADNLDLGHDISVDAAGNVYCGGQTSSALGESPGGSRDAVVVKFNSSGVLQWINHIGGDSYPAATTGLDGCAGIDVDMYGNVFCGGLIGGAFGEGFGGGHDAFIMKLDPDGNLTN